MPDYRRLQILAIIISILSVVYNAAEGGISIGFGAGIFTPARNIR
jgi:hypothetical protein